MQKITQLSLDNTNRCLLIEFDNAHCLQFDYEYLRVFSSAEMLAKKNHALPEVYHKKNVLIIAIEPLGKYGYRFIFDDDHNAVFATDYLLNLYHDHDRNWPLYLESLKASRHNREAIINFKQLD